LAAAILILAVNAAGGNAAQIECADAATPPPPAAAAAFTSYCGRCHSSTELAARYFAGTTDDQLDRREGELAAFLDRHSSCPHRHHEEIAAWLRQLSTGR
jgi:hypothetical protein